MNAHYLKTLKTLERFLSPATARALLSRSMKEQGLSPTRLMAGDLMRMESDLRRGVQLFVDAAKRGEADRAISQYCGGDKSLPQGVSIPIRGEEDISRVRAQARRLCTDCGANPFCLQKVATVVSELARNIVLYVGEGELSITPQQKPNGTQEKKVTIVICASDEGPGIPNIDQILAGGYQSKTGLGKGILGTKRLAESFDVATSSGGTTITAEIAV